MTLASCRAGLLTNIRDSSKEREEKKDRPKEEVKPPKFDLIFRNPKAKDCGLSLRRFEKEEDGLRLFEQFREKIFVLVRATDSFPGRDLMGKWMHSAVKHPSWTIAHLAAVHNQLDVLKHQLVARYLNEVCEEGRTPLIMAIESLNTPVVQLLVDQGARVDTTDHYNNSPFHYAIKLESKSLLEIICRAQGACVGMNQKNYKGQTPLQAACMIGLTGCVEHLLRQGADVNSASFSKNSQKLAGRHMGDRELGLYSERQMRKGGTPLHWVKTRLSLELMIDIGCDLNARNSTGDTALHVVADKRRLDSLIWLLIEGADVNAKGNNDDTPLHVAVRGSNPQKPQDAWMLFKQKAEQKKSYVWPNTHEQKYETLPIIQILLAFGADPNALNKKGETPRHIASVMASDLHNPRFDQLLFTLHAIGAQRCTLKTFECTEGCSPNGTFDGVPPADFGKDTNEIFDGPLSNTILKKAVERRQNAKLRKDQRKRRCRALAIDGGGVKGLMTLRALKCLEEAVEAPIIELFDWIMGTSAGGISALCLASGRTLDEVFRSAFRLKEKFIVGPRPYDTDGVEEFLKKELGDDTKFSDIKKPRIAVTAVNAESWPTRLKLFRNYDSPRALLDGTPEPPDNEWLWSAARATGAAPTFFRPYKKYLDGAVMSNNPTLDLLTEITEYNASMENQPSEQFDIDIIVSVGGGMRPTAPVSTIDALQLDPGLFGAARVAYSVGHLLKFCVEQIAEPDGRHVDRARAWCYGLGVPYARLQPALSQYVAVNESDNKVIAKMLWETMAYFRQHSDELALIADLLRNDKT
ncbi:85/88 kDa calcium-independent phospholipase A2-like isoform X2 [Varroa jacobsoni]|nr:85/88 kDa calcium-independent phospholipase A2-like isoform X2 [Varroa destructor]XP_022700210.1 85/88 kDa calcium-independent phospholipase A2-like isoform X2 [Varroa jacobsoni]